jgi:hypothetical protein
MVTPEAGLRQIPVQPPSHVQAGSPAVKTSGFLPAKSLLHGWQDDNQDQIPLNPLAMKA